MFELNNSLTVLPDDLKMLCTGVKPSADANMTQAQPLGEDILQIANDQAAGGADTKTGKEADGPSVDRENTHEDPDVTKPETAADHDTSEAGDAALGVALPGDQPTKPDPATADDDPAVPSLTVAAAAAASAGKLSAQATLDSLAGTVEPSAPATTSEFAAEQSLPAGPESHHAASKDAVEAESNAQQDVAVPMDEDKT